MRLTEQQLISLGEDAQRIHFIDTAFLLSQRPDRVGVAVSGGGDSMALLHMVHVWSGLTGVPIQVATVNHGLRPEAKDEAEMVGAFCARLGVAHTTLHWDGASAEGNLQAAAREARYDLIERWAVQANIGGVLLGHTVDDVAETFLMRLSRKAGVDGLAIMGARFGRGDVVFSRPLWQSTRTELRDYLRRHDVPWVDDPSNQDERFERAKARKVLAALQPLGITSDVLKGVALNMEGASVALGHYAAEEARTHVSFEAGDVIMPLRARPPIPPEIERRLRRASVQFVAGTKYPPRESALINLEIALVSQDRHTVGGCLVTQKDKMVRFTRELAACERPVVWGNRTLAKVWDARWLVSAGEGNETTEELTIRALGEDIKDVPDWRDTGLPRTSLMATPAVFDGDTLIAAPVAGLQNGFEARIVADFTSFLLSR